MDVGSGMEKPEISKKTDGKPDPRFNKHSKGCCYITYHGLIQHVIKCHEKKLKEKKIFLYFVKSPAYLCLISRKS
jgi:hypothetical protein